MSFVTERAEQNDDNFITILAIALGGAGLLLVIVLIVVVVVVAAVHAGCHAKYYFISAIVLSDQLVKLSLYSKSNKIDSSRE